jgi:hypothetical protein
MGRSPGEDVDDDRSKPEQPPARRRAASTVAGLERCLPYPEYLLPA